MQILNLNLKLSNCKSGWAYIADGERSGTFWRDGRQVVGLAAGGKHAASHVHTINPAGRHGGALIVWWRCTSAATARRIALGSANGCRIENLFVLEELVDKFKLEWWKIYADDMVTDLVEV